MKKLIILLCSTFILFSCEEVVQIDVPSRAPKLIIDATFNVYFNQTPVTANTAVKLTLSSDYFDENIPSVTDATVFVTNLSDASIINFLDADADGIYEPATSFIPADNTEYELTVIYDNQTYKSVAKKVKSSKFIDARQGDKTLFTGKETEVIIEFADDENVENFYLVHYGKNKYDALEDRFFNGNLYNKSEFFQEEDIELPATITISLSGVTKAYFTYFRILLGQSGSNGGGPFETVPSSLLGNIVNTSDTKNFPLGYFHISETDTAELELVAKE